MGGTAVRNAAEALAVKAREIAARLLEVDAADIELGSDGFAVRGVPGAALDWAALATLVHQAGINDGRDGSPLIAEAEFTMAGSTFPFGAHVCVVEVDVETGHTTLLRHLAVDDCGTVINPMLVRGQQHGGAVQGISQALWEEFVYDDVGTPMTSSFADYALPTAADVVQLETAGTVTTSPLNPLGAKGIGESATVGATPAVQNAVIDAVRHLGVRHIDIPCTPVRVFTALTEAREGRHEVWRTPPAAFDRLAVTTSPQEDVEV